ncbi:MAG: FAD-dependent oxidoreductase [Fimbriimonadaceae bacterium]
MSEVVLIAGGGLGGCAAALALADSPLPVVLTESTDWLGGQATSQAVPPDEHPWIEERGATAAYRDFRRLVRGWYRRNRSLTAEAAANPELNPGGGFVSRICFEPRVGVEVLEGMLSPQTSRGRLEVLLRHEVIALDVRDNRVVAATLRDLDTGSERTVAVRVVIDATEQGDLLPLAGAEYVIGAESRHETGEPHAPDAADPYDVQAFTWCMILGYDPDGDHRMARPTSYDFWRTYQPDFWPGPLLGWTTAHPITLEPRVMPLLPSEGRGSLFEYRQIVRADRFTQPLEEATVVNWPQNDYWLGRIIDEPAEVVRQRLHESRELSMCWLYWLQHEAPRPDGGVGYPGLRLRPDLAGTEDGLAKAPYIRESRRIRARFTLCEQHLTADANPGCSQAPPLPHSVGVGAYRLDIHPTTGGRHYFDVSSLPFQIPMGCLIPVRMSNLLPGAKNLGVTQIANGCTRLHPVEWNVGEAAGALALAMVQQGVSAQAIFEQEQRREAYLRSLDGRGVEREWRDVRPL